MATAAIAFQTRPGCDNILTYYSCLRISDPGERCENVFFSVLRRGLSAISDYRSKFQR